MTAVASPPPFPASRSSWGTMSGNSPVKTDELRAMFAPRKQLSRSSSSSSISSTASNTTIATNGSQSNGSQSNGTPLSAASDLTQWSANPAPRKRSQPGAPWPIGKADLTPDFSRLPSARNVPARAVATHNTSLPGLGPGHPQMLPQGGLRPPPHDQFPPGQPVLYLLSLNGTFERKTIAVPFVPDSLRIGRQTNQKTVPTPTNGFFDSKVLSRQHAEIFAERSGKIFIRDVKSSNGTFVNGTRLSPENRESEPHELQTADFVELGIDIVSEDQKTVIHHKVAAKVEHAGFLSNTNNVLDMNFGDLDPANGTMMVPSGPLHMRGRTASNASIGPNGGRAIPLGGPLAVQSPAVPQNRQIFISPVATDQILKRLATGFAQNWTDRKQNEMRSARLHAQDLNRTNQFVNTLLSKDDVKDLDKPDAPEPSKPQHAATSSSVSFRSDHKARFSDPPAPPPQQPLPEKPDVPSLKRGSVDRPKSGSVHAGPARQDKTSQILQLTEALNSAKRDMDAQSARVRELEVMLQREREAREVAEGLVQKLDGSSIAGTNGVTDADAVVTEDMGDVSEEGLHEDTEMNGAKSRSQPVKDVAPSTGDAVPESQELLLERFNATQELVRKLGEELDKWKQRCKAAESERDESQKTLAEMVTRLRAEEAERTAAPTPARSRSKRSQSGRSSSPRGRTRRRRAAAGADASSGSCGPEPKEAATAADAATSSTGIRSDEAADESATLLRASTMTPGPWTIEALLQPSPFVEMALPYASMVGVVLLGVGVMACINSWYPPPSPLD